MDFYVSWYPGDPDYPLYDDDCSMLISVSSVARDWSVERLPRLPRRLLIDSGGYRYAIAPEEALSPLTLFKRQLDILGDSPLEAIICARDYPILDPTLSSNEKDRCITQTIAYAYEFKQLTKKYQLPPHLRTMAIIQGYDDHSFVYCANELKCIGFDLYGLGSLAVLKQHEPIIKRVEAVASVIGADKLHIFGVGVVETVKVFREMGIHSIDSARPAKAAAYNEILYSNPYRRFGILEPPHIPLTGRLPKRRRLSKPLACNCPVCKNGSSDILGVGERAFIRARALHNYYHLKEVFVQG